jgi:hypothetical protein
MHQLLIVAPTVVVRNSPRFSDNNAVLERVVFSCLHNHLFQKNITPLSTRFEPVNLVVLNRSIVVLAQAHNPSILHPSFLSAQQIVPSDWQISEAPVCTPPFSIVKYANGIVFTAESNKLMILANVPNDGALLPDLALKYVKTLPHVHYSAVGINIAGCVKCDSAETWLLARFVRSGPGNDAQLRPSAVGLKLVYPVEGGTCNLSLDAGSVQLESERVDGLIIGGNYHFALPSGNSLTEAARAIASYGSRLAHFQSLVDTVLREKC